MTPLPLMEAELQEPRSPEALLTWCNEKIEQIAGMEGGTYAIRMRRGLCKPLVEELYPLAIWASDTEDVSSSSVLTPQIGSQPFDARVTDPEREPSEYFVEITQAHMGQVEHFRMLHLHREGWAPGPLSNVVREGSSRNSSIRPGRVLGSMRGYVNKTTELIRNAVAAKITKKYPQPSILLVAFEDFILKDEEGVQDVLRTEVEGTIGGVEVPFVRIYIVGMSRHILVRVDDSS